MIAVEVEFDFPPIKGAKSKDLDEFLQYVDEGGPDSNFFRSARCRDS